MSKVLLDLYLESNLSYRYTLKPKYLQTNEIIESLIKVESKIWASLHKICYFDSNTCILRENAPLDIMLNINILLYELYDLSEDLVCFHVFDRSKVYQAYEVIKYTLQQAKIFIDLV